MALILIVEDYPSLQKIYSLAATQAGHTVLLAKDGIEALKQATEQQPDLILLDLLMPGVNGIEFLKNYDLKKHPNTKVIVFSNMHSLALEQQLTELGANLYLVKSQHTPKEVMVIIGDMLKPKASTPAQ